MKYTSHSLSSIKLNQKVNFKRTPSDISSPTAVHEIGSDSLHGELNVRSPVPGANLQNVQQC